MSLLTPVHVAEGLGVVAAVAIVIAFIKHKTLSAVEASAKKEIANLDAFAVKVGADVKSEFTAIVSKLKAIF